MTTVKLQSGRDNGWKGRSSICGSFSLIIWDVKIVKRAINPVRLIQSQRDASTLLVMYEESSGPRNENQIKSSSSSWNHGNILHEELL